VIVRFVQHVARSKEQNNLSTREEVGHYPMN